MKKQRIFRVWRVTLMDVFYRQSRRDQWLLLLCGGFVLVSLIYLFVLAPFQEQLRQASGQTQLLHNSLKQVQRLSSELKQLKQLKRQPTATTKAPVINLAELVDRSLRSHGLAMGGFQPGEEGHAQLRLDNVAYSNLLRWLYDLEVRHQLVIKELSLVKTSTAGVVSANIRLHKQ